MPELALGRLGYGAAALGNLYEEMSDAVARRVLEAAWERGIRYFDTAPHYGLGLSERRLGAFLRTKPRDEFVLSTKVGRLLRPDPEGAGRLDLDHDFVVPADLRRVWDPTEAGVRASIRESLDRLGLDRIDIAYLHDPERYDLDRGLGEALPALARLRDEGVVRAIGVGSMSTDALLAAAGTRLVDLLMVAGRYTLADQSVVPTVTELCAERGVGIVAAAVFNSGLLSGDTLVPGARYDYGEAPQAVLARVRAIAELCAELGVSLASAALQYPLRDPVVRAVVVGGTTPEQLAQNVARMSDPIPPALWARLAEAALIPG